MLGTLMTWNIEDLCVKSLNFTRVVLAHTIWDQILNEVINFLGLLALSAALGEDDVRKHALVVLDIALSFIEETGKRGVRYHLIRTEGGYS